MKLVAHDQKEDAVSHRYSVQSDTGQVWLLFDIPDSSPFGSFDIACAMEAFLPTLRDEKYKGRIR